MKRARRCARTPRRTTRRADPRWKPARPDTGEPLARWIRAVRGGGGAFRQSASAAPSLLDIGTGAADIPAALAASVSKRAPRLAITATDVRPEIVAAAAASVAGSKLTVRLGRVEDERDGAFDVVHASLVLHHLEPAAAVSLLREMRRVARVAVVINDLQRGWRWLAGASLLTRLTTRNDYTRHDAPLSVRRAYTADEVVDLARQAGLAPRRALLGATGLSLRARLRPTIVPDPDEVTDVAIVGGGPAGAATAIAPGTARLLGRGPGAASGAALASVRRVRLSPRARPTARPRTCHGRRSARWHDRSLRWSCNRLAELDARSSTSTDSRAASIGSRSTRDCSTWRVPRAPTYGVVA